MAVHRENIREPGHPISDEDLDKLFKLAETIKYGFITLYFQDGKLIQIEKNEKVRVK
jgi:hypothetical protein